MKTTLYAFLISLCSLLGMTAWAATPEQALKAALVPDASIAFYSDMEKASKSPLVKQFEQFRDKIDMTQGGIPDHLAKWADLQEFVEGLTKDLGLTPEDSLRTFFSANLGSWTFGQKLNFQQLDLLAACEFTRAVDIKKLAQALEENTVIGGVESIVEEHTIQGVPVVSVFNPQAPDNAMFTQLFVALPCDGKVLYFGGEAAVKSALGRLAAGIPAVYPEGLAELQQGVKDVDSFFLFAPTPAMRLKIAEFGKGQQATNPAMGTIMNGFATMKGTVFTVKSGDVIAFDLSLVMAKAEEAALVKSMLMDTMLLSSLKMMMMQKVGRMTPMLESMKTEQKDNVASLAAVVTQEDITIFADVFKNNAVNAAPAAPAAPAGIPAE